MTEKTTQILKNIEAIDYRLLEVLAITCPSFDSVAAKNKRSQDFEQAVKEADQVREVIQFLNNYTLMKLQEKQELYEKLSEAYREYEASLNKLFPNDGVTNGEVDNSIEDTLKELQKLIEELTEKMKELETQISEIDEEIKKIDKIEKEYNESIDVFMNKIEERFDALEDNNEEFEFHIPAHEPESSSQTSHAPAEPTVIRISAPHAEWKALREAVRNDVENRVIIDANKIEDEFIKMCKNHFTDKFKSTKLSEKDQPSLEEAYFKKMLSRYQDRLQDFHELQSLQINAAATGVEKASLQKMRNAFASDLKGLENIRDSAQALMNDKTAALESRVTQPSRHRP